MSIMREWRFIQSRPVLSNRKIRIPDEVRKPLVEVQTSPGVHWHIEKNAEFIVIASDPVGKPSYDYVCRSNILPEGGNHKIRPKDAFPDHILSWFQEDNHLHYLMYEDCEVERTGARYAFLLNEGQATEILPSVSDGGGDLTDRILNSPGFLPKL